MQLCRRTSPRDGEGDFEMGHEHRHGATSRRRIMTALAATAGGAALLPRCGLRAQPAPAPPTRRLVDTHHHYYPREIIDAWQGYMNRYSEGRLQPNVANWAPTASLEEMDTRLDPRRVVRPRCRGHAPDVAAVQRVRGEDGAGLSGPLRALRLSTDAGCRRL